MGLNLITHTPTQGSMLHPNGDVYKGPWVNDMRHGQGVWPKPYTLHLNPKP